MIWLARDVVEPNRTRITKATPRPPGDLAMLYHKFKQVKESISACVLYVV